jgi:hypothetical protein
MIIGRGAPTLLYGGALYTRNAVCILLIVGILFIGWVSWMGSPTPTIIRVREKVGDLIVYWRGD